MNDYDHHLAAENKELHEEVRRLKGVLWAVAYARGGALQVLDQHRRSHSDIVLEIRDDRVHRRLLVRALLER